MRERKTHLPALPCLGSEGVRLGVVRDEGGRGWRAGIWISPWQRRKPWSVLSKIVMRSELHVSAKGWPWLAGGSTGRGSMQSQGQAEKAEAPKQGNGPTVRREENRWWGPVRRLDGELQADWGRPVRELSLPLSSTAQTSQTTSFLPFLSLLPISWGSQGFLQSGFQSGNYRTLLNSSLSPGPTRPVPFSQAPAAALTQTLCISLHPFFLPSTTETLVRNDQHWEWLETGESKDHPT